MPILLQINSAKTIGSTGKIVEQIGLIARNEGWKCYVASSARYSSPSKLHEIKIGGIFSEKIHALLSHIFDAHGLGSYFETKKFINKIKKINPDIIHLHNIHGYYINYKILFKYLTTIKIPIVWTFHDCWPMTGHCVHYTAVNCYKWQTECKKCPRLYGYPKSYVFDNSRRNFRLKKRLFSSVENLTIVTVSKWLSLVVKQSYMSKYPIHIIPNGIDINSFYPRKYAVNKIRNKYELGDKFVILGVATGWSQDNGFYDFLELRKMLDYEYIIVLVGVTKAQKDSLPKGIVGINRIDNVTELAEIYSTADIFVNGSYEETFGLVTAEAISCGTPVIVYDSTACPDIVTPETGFVIPIRDIATMSKTIIAYATNADRDTYSFNCCRYAELNLDKEARYAEYINIYNAIINRQNAKNCNNNIPEF